MIRWNHVDIKLMNLLYEKIQIYLINKKPTHLSLKKFNDNVTISFTPNFISDWKMAREIGINSQLFDFNKHTSQALDFKLPRKLWCNLNRLRTGHGNCNEMLFKWGYADCWQSQLPMWSHKSINGSSAIRLPDT